MNTLDFLFNQRALLTALLIGFANGYLSGFIVLRGSALMVGSLSHTLLPGIALAILAFGILNAFTAFFGALFAALLVGLGAILISRNSRLDGDSALAILYTTAFAAGLLLIDRLAVTSELEHWLFGNILGLRDSDLWLAFGVSALIVLTLTALRRPLVIMLFEPTVAETLGIRVRGLSYLLMALMVLGLVTSLQAVGCILSLSLLVAPASIVYLFTNSPRTLFWGGALLGALAAGSAVFVSSWLDIRTGATIVLLLGVLFMLGFLFSPRHGLIARLVSSPPASHNP